MTALFILKIIKTCDGKESCVLYASNDIFGNPCPVYSSKYIHIKYSCEGNVVRFIFFINDTNFTEDHVVTLKNKAFMIKFYVIFFDIAQYYYTIACQHSFSKETPIIDIFIS